MTQTPDADTTEVADRWQWVFDLPHHLTEDAPMLEHVLGHNREEAARAAAAEGVELIGEPTVTSEPAYWEKDFGEHGGFVGDFLASPETIAAGPKLHRYRYVWEARKLATPDAP